MKGKPLSQIKSDVHKLIGMLRGQLDIMASAAEGLNNLRSPVHPYQSNAAQYAGLRDGSNEAQQIQAQQAVAAASAKAERIKQELAAIAQGLQHHLNVWDDNLYHLRSDTRRIKEAYAGRDQYRIARNATEQEKRQIIEILNTIRGAQKSTGRGISGSWEHTQKTVAGSIDELVGKTNVKGKFTAQNNYGLLPVTYETIPLLDADRYGAVNYQPMVEYPKPKLMSDEDEPLCDVSDKINQGLGFSETQRTRNYQVELPDYLLGAFYGKYAPQDGIYSARY